MKLSITSLLAAVLSSFCCSAQPDLKPTLVFPVDYLPVGTHLFDVMVQSVGTATVPVGAFKICWQVDNGTITEAVPTAPAYTLGANMPQAVRVRGNFMAAFTAPGTHKLKVWTRTTSVTDGNNTNDTLISTVKVLPYVPAKNVLMEVFKHQACCPCLPAAYYEDSIIAPMADYAIANIYTVSTDVMYNSDGEIINDEYDLAHPAVFFDRYKFAYAYSLDRDFYTFGSDYQLTDLGERERYYEPVEVSFSSASFNTTTRLLQLTVKAKFYDTLSGDYRFNLYLTEDSIKAWQGCATPDPYDYYHKHVLRHMFGGAWGQQGSLPPMIYPGEQKFYQFSYTVPASYKTEHMELIALVQRYTADSFSRKILNSAKISFGNALTLDVPGAMQDGNDIQVYPNPATDKVQLHIAGLKQGGTAELFDLSGRLVQSMSIEKSDTELNIAGLPAGIYRLRLDLDGSFRSFSIEKR